MQMLEDHKLYSLGMCLAFDIIINNCDRFKLVSRGPGNIKNILIQVKDFDSVERINRARDRENTES